MNTIESTNVEIIPATKEVPRLEIIPALPVTAIEDRKLNIAAYCRVSTLADEQINSLQTQQNYFAKLAANNSNWKLVKVFYDEGLTGTTLKKRDGFNDMIARAESGEIDLIITKSVSRFSRNARNTLNIANRLREKHVYIYFITDKLNTEVPADMDRLAIIAARAQEESSETSVRVKFGQMESMKAGVVFGRDMLGYNVDNGILTINEDDVEVVQLIYRLYLEGDGTHVIARKLQEAGYAPKDPDGKARYKNGWSSTVILRVLRNEKYCGDLLQKKTITVDTLEHTKKYNRGEEEMIFIKNHHEAIIDRATWDAVQKELKRRSPSQEQKAKHSNRYWCSGKIICGLCGRSFVARRKKLKGTDVPYKAWRCFEGANHGRKKEVPFGDEKIEVGCNSESVSDIVLQESIRTLIGFILQNKDELKAEILQEIQEVKKIKVDTKKKSAIEAKQAKNEKRMKNLITMLADENITKAEYEAMRREYLAESDKLREELDAVINIERMQKEQERIGEKYIAAIDSILALDGTQNDETIFNEITKKIVVQPNHYLDIYLTCLPLGIQLHYEATGRGKNYRVSFDNLEMVAAQG